MNANRFLWFSVNALTRFRSKIEFVSWRCDCIRDSVKHLKMCCTKYSRQPKKWQRDKTEEMGHTHTWNNVSPTDFDYRRESSSCLLTYARCLCERQEDKKKPLQETNDNIRTKEPLYDFLFSSSFQFNIFILSAVKKKQRNHKILFIFPLFSGPRTC